MKRIILLSDGTGNSSAKLFKTNVWRMYQSLDLDPAGAGVRQIACYNDGVGTSAFRPLALLGGMFGYGLKRNVLHLYGFLCQNWEPGDEISIFGFSRGAFTARIVAGLIAREGLLLGQDSRTLAHAIRDIYRHYRFADEVIISMPGLARLIRRILLHAWRRLMRQTEYEQLNRTEVQEIAFLGVWDTVAAYGTPLAELTRGIDKWVFPLSMPDRLLHPKVGVARHALALDDERDTFHPLLWDELNSAQPHRIKQVWFAGMHSDVGGGYPDDGLSFQPLAWMMDEAATAGLRFLPGARERFAPPPNRSAPLHDSRKGVAGYYRYQPRKLSAYMLPDDPETVIMRDPTPKARAHLTRVLLHHSVINRIVSSDDRYSPIVLPASFDVVQADGTVVASQEAATARDVRLTGQKRVWDAVWRKRVNYFAMVLVSIAMGCLPLFATRPEHGACEAFYCALSPVIRGLGAFLPGVLQYWTDAFATHPGITLLFLCVFVPLLLWGSSEQQRIHDQMWPLWAPLRGGAIPGAAPGNGFVYNLRTSRIYLGIVGWIKWKLLPFGFGFSTFLAIIAGSVVMAAIPVVRQVIAIAESNGSICGPAVASEGKFQTNMLCWDSGTSVLAGKSYRVELAIDQPWLDDTIPSGAKGYDADQIPWFGYLALPIRRSINGRWFQPFVTIVSSDGKRFVQPLEFQEEGGRYVATLMPTISGELLMWVNDAVVGRNVITGYYYENNHGSAQVHICQSDLDRNLGSACKRGPSVIIEEHR